MSKIQIPDELAARIERRIQYTDFDTVDEYAEYILSEVLASIEQQEAQPDSGPASSEEIEDRLRSLGYLGE